MSMKFDALVVAAGLPAAWLRSGLPMSDGALDQVVGAALKSAENIASACAVPRAELLAHLQDSR